MARNNAVRQNVLELVGIFPTLKENYNDLALHYWVIYDNCRDMHDIAKATPAETITRNLRKLVELGLVELPERVANARREKEREFKTEFSSLT